MLFIRDNWTGFAMQHAHKLSPVFQRFHRCETFEGTSVAAIRRFIRSYKDLVWTLVIEGCSTFHSTLTGEAKP